MFISKGERDEGDGKGDQRIGFPSTQGRTEFNSFPFAYLC